MAVDVDVQEQATVTHVTEYEAISEAMDAAFTKHVEYRQEAIKFGGDLYYAFERFLGAPPGKLGLLDPDGRDGEKAYAVWNALRLGDDAYARMRIGVFFQFRLCDTGSFTIPVQFKKKDDLHWEVSLMPNGRDAQLVNPSVDAELERLVREYARAIRENFRNRFDDFMSGRKPGILGFAFDSDR